MKTPHPDDDFASIIVNQVIDTAGKIMGYILIKDSTHHSPKWKLASGRGRPGETPQECAQRENKEETGIDRLVEDYQEIESGRWYFPPPNMHWSHLFLVKIPLSDVGKIHSNDPGNEGEVPHYFTLLELQIEEHYETILPHHLKKIKLVEELQQAQAA